jgi:hypothetical protein
MRRRELLKGMTAAAAGMYLTPAPLKTSTEEAKRQVEKVYVLWKCHLDIDNAVTALPDDFRKEAVARLQTLSQNPLHKSGLSALAAGAHIEGTHLWSARRYLYQLRCEKLV